MATPLITSHIVVEFGDPAAAAEAKLEIDDRPAGLNSGRTSFYPGDSVGMLLFIPEGYEVTGTYVTAGTLDDKGASFKAVEEFAEFANEDTAGVGYPMPSTIVTSFIGTVPSNTTVTRADASNLRLSARPIDPVTNLPTPQYRLAVVKANYDSPCLQYQLTSVPLGVTRVMIFFVISLITP